MKKEAEETGRREIYSEPVFTKGEKKYELREVADCVMHLSACLKNIIERKFSEDWLLNKRIDELIGIKNRMSRITNCKGGEEGWKNRKKKGR